MGFDKYLLQIERIDRLVRLRATGTPKDLARKLEVSERTVYAFVDFMKARKAPIVYDRHIRSYIYTDEGGYNFDFKKS